MKFLSEPQSIYQFVQYGFFEMNFLKFLMTYLLFSLKLKPNIMNLKSSSYYFWNFFCIWCMMGLACWYSLMSCLLLVVDWRRWLKFPTGPSQLLIAVHFWRSRTAHFSRTKCYLRLVLQLFQGGDKFGREILYSPLLLDNQLASIWFSIIDIAMSSVTLNIQFLNCVEAMFFLFFLLNSIFSAVISWYSSLVMVTTQFLSDKLQSEFIIMLHFVHFLWFFPRFRRLFRYFALTFLLSFFAKKWFSAHFSEVIFLNYFSQCKTVFLFRICCPACSQFRDWFVWLCLKRLNVLIRPHCGSKTKIILRVVVCEFCRAVFCHLVFFVSFPRFWLFGGLRWV